MQESDGMKNKKRLSQQSKLSERNLLMDHFLMKPKIDFAFKKIMENEKARTGFYTF